MKLDGKIISLLFAAMAGALMAVQGAFNSITGKIIGLIEGTFSVHLLGAVTAGILTLLFGKGGFQKFGEVPWYAWLGGPIGVAIIFGVAVSIPKLGVGMATTAIIGAQLLAAYAIDHFGLFGLAAIPFNLAKLAGIILIVAGAKILLN
ncbi:MAG: DMT family transporter [Firmicutes bacterium]|nr:DMT family transporter [Bacillota bacterium]